MMRSNFDSVVLRNQNNEGTNANLHWLESFQKKISPKESFYGFVTFQSGLNVLIASIHSLDGT